MASLSLENFPPVHSAPFRCLTTPKTKVSGKLAWWQGDLQVYGDSRKSGES